MQRSTLSVAALALSVTLLASCSAPQGSKDVTSGQLTVACSQQEDFCQKITQEFQKMSGIPTTYVRLGAGEVLARLQATQGEFDVWAGGQAENHLIASQKGWIENYISPNAEKLSSEYNDDQGIWSGFYTDSISFCYNEDEIKSLGIEPPHSWKDLLAPELKGKIVMSHPATAGVGYMVLYTVEQVYGADRDQAIDYLKKLDSNILQYSKSSATSTLMAGRSEIAVGIALDSDCAKAQQEGFDSLKYSYPVEGTGYEVGAVSVLKGAKNREAAEKFMDYVLSVEAQNLYGDIPSYAVPTLQEATLGDNVPPQKDIVKVEWDVAKAAEERDSFLEVFTSQIASSDEAK